MVLPVSVSRAALRGGVQRLVAANTVSRSSIVERPLSTSTMHDNDPELLEREKQRNLSGTQKHRYENAPGWNEHLASESEATVKSMRSESESTVTLSAEDLQKQTVDHLKASDLQNSEDSSIMAPLGEVLDQVTGPLKSALGKEGKDSK